jgi:hypothetical protein
MLDYLNYVGICFILLAVVSTATQRDLYPFAYALACTVAFMAG